MFVAHLEKLKRLAFDFPPGAEVACVVIERDQGIGRMTCGSDQDYVAIPRPANNGVKWRKVLVSNPAMSELIVGMRVKRPPKFWRGKIYNRQIVDKRKAALNPGIAGSRRAYDENFQSFCRDCILAAELHRNIAIWSSMCKDFRSIPELALAQYHLAGKLI